MNSERTRQVTSIFHSAIERVGAERRAFPGGACADDAELRRGVDALTKSQVLKVSPTTVQREWRAAKAWLHRAISEGGRVEA
jgi:hypothetical protein